MWPLGRMTWQSFRFSRQIPLGCKQPRTNMITELQLATAPRLRRVREMRARTHPLSLPQLVSFGVLCHQVPVWMARPQTSTPRLGCVLGVYPLYPQPAHAAENQCPVTRGRERKPLRKQVLSLLCVVLSATRRVLHCWRATRLACRLVRR